MKIREIEARELAEELLGGCVVGERGFDCGWETTEMDAASTDSDHRPETAFALRATNTLEAARIPRIRPSIPVVITVSTDAEVAPPVIKSVAVYMIDLKPGWAVHDRPVQQAILLALCIDRAPTTNDVSRMRPLHPMPLAAAKPFVVGFVKQDDFARA